MSAFQKPESSGLHNFSNLCAGCVAQGAGTYRGIAVHSFWLHFSPDQILDELDQLEHIELGPATPMEVAGFPAIQIDATVPQRTMLYENRAVIDNSWFLHAHQRMRFITVDTPAGSLLITIAADIDEFDNFLPVAEEILNGISFPDLN